MPDEDDGAQAQINYREVNARLLDVRPLSLVFSALANLFELARHLLYGLSETGQLASDARF